MISRLELKFGSSPGKPGLVISPAAVTVFVGPNNSGKSKIITEIAAQCTEGVPRLTDLILADITFDGFNAAEAEDIIRAIEVMPDAGTKALPQHIWVANGSTQSQVPKPQLLKALYDPNDPDARRWFAKHYLGAMTLTLNGRNRIDLVKDQTGGDLLQPARTSFQKLFQDNELRKRYSDVVHKSLDNYAVIDPTSLGKLRLRLSSTEPPSPQIERGLDIPSVEFHRAAQHIADASDGAKAFTGVLAEIFAGDPKVLLMDEPEAFLHPALAFNLGREIARSLAATDKQMFVSTHSPQFLMGCIQSGVAINVVRLTYRKGIPTARLLPSSEIVRLMRNPLLRSAGVISALFYESVVVTEGDPDRAFYNEINERLLRRGRGIPNCVFLNAQNKQTIPTILGPLRGLGIPAAAVYDIDFVKDGGGVATRFMETAGIPELAQNGLTTTRAVLATKLKDEDEHYKKHGGIKLLANADRAAANDYFDQLDAYGAFVVREGELEVWLKTLGISGHGPTWLIPMFESMGEDPDAPGYVQPASGDVWSFIDKIAAWLLDPQRKGIPD